METAALATLLLTCAPQVHAQTALAIVQVESSANPWAIGVVGDALERQPRSLIEALATARSLRAGGWNFSVGLGQINAANFGRLGLSLESAFEPCANLAAMQAILVQCFDRAAASMARTASQSSLRRALSCYYSGNFSTGFREGYVHRVTLAATSTTRSARHASGKEPS